MILANTPAGVRAVQRLDPLLPVVMIVMNDPVGAGLGASLAHPGNRTTGTATLNEDVTPKLLEFGGRVDLLFDNLPGSLPSVRAGQVKPVAVTATALN